jgi:glycosyltransferase involved in cell wall biosynthesis
MEALKDLRISTRQPENTVENTESANPAGKIQHQTRAKALSIIIPALNEEKYIGGLLSDIASNTLDKNAYEIIVSDNGSIDGTASIVSVVALRNPNAKIKLVSVPERGVSRARNNGAAASEGQYLLFIDADARLHDPRYLEKILKEMKEKKLDLATLRPTTDSFVYADHIICAGFNHLMTKTISSSMPAVAGGAGVVTTKDLHQKTGGFDEKMKVAEDVDYVKRGLQFGRFGIIESAATTFNNRRFAKEGRLKLCAKYTVAGILTSCGVKKMPFDFKAGEF